MTEIKVMGRTQPTFNMSVSIPDEVYEKFLSELERDGFVFAKFGEYILVLSKWDGENDLSAVDGKHGGTGRRQASANAKAEENAGTITEDQTYAGLGRMVAFIAPSNPAHPIIVKDDKIMCKCGHWIGIVGTKWQHIDEEYIRTVFDDAYTPQKKQIKYREKCYTCDCAEPTPLVRTNIAVRGE